MLKQWVRNIPTDLVREIVERSSSRGSFVWRFAAEELARRQTASSDQSETSERSSPMANNTYAQLTAAARSNRGAVSPITQPHGVPSSGAKSAPYQELSKACKELADRNAENLSASLQALVSIRNPADFLELPQKLAKTGIDTAVSNGKNVINLSAMVLTAAIASIHI